MSRFFGIVLLAALVALSVGIRQHALTRSQQISRGETIAGRRAETLAATLRREISPDDNPAERLATLGRQKGLRSIPNTGTERTAFAEDDLYVYGLGLTTPIDPTTGRPSSGWVLRAWPREFGVTGDIEFHIDHRGAVWHGQNEVGRSGVEEGFPPKFPAKEISQARQAVWWHPAP